MAQSPQKEGLFDQDNIQNMGYNIRPDKSRFWEQTVADFIAWLSMWEKK